MAVNRGIGNQIKRWLISVHNVGQCKFGEKKPLEIHDIEARRFSRQSEYEGGKVSSPTLRLPFVPRRHSWPSTVLEFESNPGPHCDRKD
jgi:hypothetical protein